MVTVASGKLGGWHTITDAQLELLADTAAGLAVLQEVTQARSTGCALQATRGASARELPTGHHTERGGCAYGSSTRCGAPHRAGASGGDLRERIRHSMLDNDTVPRLGQHAAGSGSGSRGALLRPGPLRTVLAACHRTRLKQAPKAHGQAELIGWCRCRQSADVGSGRERDGPRLAFRAARQRRCDVSSSPCG